MLHQVDVQSSETQLNTTWFDFAVFDLRVSMLNLKFKFVPVIKFQLSFVWYGRDKLYSPYIWLFVVFKEYFS
mgnify:CR=1 FL=1